MAGLDTVAGGVHKDCGISRIKKDVAAVQAVISLLSSGVGPFPNSDDDDSLVNITSGAVATEAIKRDLLHAFDIEKKAFTRFVEDRIVTSSVAFHNPIKKLNLKTFSALTKQKPVAVHSGEIIVRADRDLFARLLVVAQGRSLDLRKVLCYELGPVPWSLSSVDGRLVKTAKSKLLQLIEKGVPLPENVSATSAWMIDAMATLQTITAIPATFGELANLVFDVTAMPFRSGSKRVDFVVDRYPELSIKSQERQSRSQKGMVKIKIAGRTQKCPTQWKKYLSVDSNKVNLIEFLQKEWIRNEYAAKLHGNNLFVTHEDKCTRLTSTDGLEVCATDVWELRCSHEEADTRLLLHATHAEVEGHSSVVIRSPDTDVAVIACGLSHQFESRLYFKTGTKTRSRYVDIDRL